MTTTTPTPAVRTRPAWVTVGGAVVVAVAVNLVVYGIGRAAGATFDFSSTTGPANVDPATVAGFTAVPLLVGLTLAALLGRRWTWVVPAALVIAPALAVATIFLMTVPADLDTASTVTLACCHLALVPISVLALRALRH
ncbi:DUF6069 family protein [Cellulomonas terrae]|uniref:Major facilitator superfamily (MFS) profile domain-containing protein n=1 Tax=Cellulomonas terrae TaxID=311234 RepID=A0A511JJU8_9CELL|nr:DUF6069 family protein [Cellulomonas terrae]GEL98288.1 hypothetical protein CTE05_18350 [Cellulomonas terrae]